MLLFLWLLFPVLSAPSGLDVADPVDIATISTSKTVAQRHGRDQSSDAPEVDVLDDITWPERWEEMQPSATSPANDPESLSHREGLAFFAQGRLAFQGERFPTALVSYQRALRMLGPTPELIQQIMGIAVSLGRVSVAAQYALLLDDIQADDMPLVRYLAMYLADEEDFAGATKLFDLVLQQLAKTSRRETFVLTHFEQGRLLFALGDHPRSARSMAIVEEAIRDPEKYSLDDETIGMLTDKPQVTFTFLGEAFLEDDRLDLAERMFRRAYEDSPDKPALAFHLARIHARRHDDAKLTASLKKYFQSEDDSAGMGPYKLLAELSQRKNDDETTSIIDEVVRLQDRAPRNIPRTIYCADRMAEMGKKAEADKLYRQVLKHTAVAEAFQGLAHLAMERGDAEELRELIAQLVDHRGDLADLGSAYKKLLDNKPIIERMLQLPPSSTQTVAQRRATDLGMGLLALAAKMPDAAARLSNRIVDGVDLETRVGWGLELLLAEQFDQAVQVLQAAQRLDVPDGQRATLRYHLSGALAMAKRTDEALAVIQQAINENPDSMPFLERDAWIRYHADRLPEAEATYLTLVDRFDDNYDSSSVRQTLQDVKMSLSNLCVEREDYAEAERWLDEVLDEFPTDIGAKNDLGYLWADQGKHLHLALAFIEDAASKDPTNIAYQDSWGWTLHKLGRHEDAQEHLEKAAAGDDPDPVILDHWAEVMVSLNRPDEAQKLWQRASDILYEIKEKTSSERRLQKRLSTKIKH